jgi:adenylate cyclase
MSSAAARRGQTVDEADMALTTQRSSQFGESETRADGLVTLTHAGSEAPLPISQEDDLAAGLSPTDWLLNRGHDSKTARGLMRRLCAYLVAYGIPLHRASIFVRTLHPQTNGHTVIWRKSRPDPEELMVMRGIESTQGFMSSPLPLIFEGATDYVAMPLVFSDGQINFITWTSDQPGGFTMEQLSLLDALRPALSLRLEVMSRRRLTQLLLKTYLGPDAGQRVLGGTIERGQGETINAVIWFSDLRGFTTLSDSLPAEEIINLLNDYFENIAIAVEERGGQILKFLGDGVLAIFLITEDDPTPAANNALLAADDARVLMGQLNARRARREQLQIQYGIDLHVRPVNYGNIGSPTRLDFTVIGPAVNLASRIQSMSKNLNCQIVASSTFAKVASGCLISAGWHPIRGLSEPVELFRPPNCTIAA